LERREENTTPEGDALTMSQAPDLSTLQSQLTVWLKPRMPEARNLNITDLKKPGMGLSSETYLLTINWEEAGKDRSRGVVLRSAPKELKVFPEYELGHQYRIMQILKDTDVPVAEMLWLEEDPAVIGAPFFLMRRLDGEVPPDFPSYHGSGMFYEASPALRAKMWWGSLEAMAKIHLLDWKGLGLAFLGEPGGGTNPVDRQLAYWEQYFEWVKDSPDESHPTLEASLAWLKDHRYEPEHVALCWGDSRMGNTLYSKPARDVLAVMDWEMAYIGDPEADLAHFILLDWQHCAGAGIARCEGTPSADETIARYEELTGWKVKNLFFNEVFAAARYGLILVSVFRKFRQQSIPIEEDMILNNVCTQRLSELLDLPSPGPKKTEMTDVNQMTVTLQFHFTGPGGHDWYILADKGKGSRHEGTVENPTCTVIVSAADWEAIRNGKLNRLDAWSTGRLVVEGDLNVMIQLEQMVSELAS
jgi:aminoglycoside phosphotransferase (APT) family kinase protein/putative sterol carrier protein